MQAKAPSARLQPLESLRRRDLDSPSRRINPELASSLQRRIQVCGWGGT